MNTVLIIPTGIGAKIGGNAGDANPVAKLIGSVSDKLITHPNVVNAADINEMPSDTLYVEGSQLDEFLKGRIGLTEVRSNRILVAVNAPVRPETINAVSAARVTLGADIKIVELDKPLKMQAEYDTKTGQATGIVEGHEELITQVLNISDWDTLAVATPISVAKEAALNYVRKGGVNPWGGVEAKASKLIAKGIKKPIAHAPLETPDNTVFKGFNEIVPPPIAPEMVSVCYLHCVLKGLYKAPKIESLALGTNIRISVDNVDVMITPMGCWGIPHKLCEWRNIPIIVVKENQTILHQRMGDSCIYVNNYLEAAGLIQAMKIGVTTASLRNKVYRTKIIKGKENINNG